MKGNNGTGNVIERKKLIIKFLPRLIFLVCACLVVFTLIIEWYLI